MSFSHLTRLFRDVRPSRPTRTRLQADALEDRCTPTSSLVTSNAILSGSGNGTGDTILAQSRDGRFLVISSTSTDLVPGQVDVAGTPDLFWFDTASGQRKLITAKTGTNGTEALGTAGTQAVLSADGQAVAFVSRSQASFLDPAIPAAGDAGSFTDDIFRWTAAGTVVLVSKESTTTAFGATVASANPAISNDGSVVGFTSLRDASAVDAAVVDNGNLSVDLFRFTAGTGAVSLVTYANPNAAVGSFVSTTPDAQGVSVDPFGRYMDGAGLSFAYMTSVSPASIDPTLTAYAVNAKNSRDAYLASFGGKNTTNQLVSSVASNPLRGVGVSNGRVSNAILAPDNPQVVVFTASAASGKLNELVAGYTNNNAGKDDLYLRVMTGAGGLTTNLITATNGTTNVGANGALDTTGTVFDVSADGGRVAFSSAATNIVPTLTDTNDAPDIFGWSLATFQNTGVSFNSLGGAGGVASTNPVVSSDGRFVSFQSASTNLVGIADTNGASDVFVRDLQTGVLSVASTIANGSQTGNAASTGGRVGGAGTGARVAYLSQATNLDPLFTTPAGQTNAYAAVLPIQTSGASTFGVVSGTKSAAMSFASFTPQGQLVVGDKFTPFPGFSGEVRVAVGDVNGDGVLDLVAGAGPTGGPRVVVINGATGTAIRSFFAYESTFTGGVYVATGDINGDGFADVFVGAGEGGGPRVRVVSGKNGAGLADFFVYEPSFRGGVRVATGDVNGDGTFDLVTGAGEGGGPRVTVTSGKTIGTSNTRLADFFAFELSLRNGVYVSAGDYNNDGKADLGIGAGPGGAPRVTVFDAVILLSGSPAPTQLLNFFAGSATERNGIRVALKNIDGDATADVLTGGGSGGPSRIRTYSGGQFSAPGVPALIDDIFLYGDPSGILGAWVG